MRLEEIIDPVTLLAADHLHRHLEPFAHVDVNHFELWDLSGFRRVNLNHLGIRYFFVFSSFVMDRLHLFQKLMSWWEMKLILHLLQQRKSTSIIPM